MGDEITQVAFTAADFHQFAARLQAETEFACRWLQNGHFSGDAYSVGFELEAWLVDHSGYPHPINELFLQTLNHPLVVPELSRFNVELNTTPRPLAERALQLAEQELSALWAECNATAHGLDTNMLMIGTLPTIRNQDLTLANISRSKRYSALNNELLRQRHDQPLRIDIAGVERLTVEHSDVMLEAATTSFQIHLQIPAALAQGYYNASVRSSGPLLAACCNAPFLFGKTLWEETRIPLFEQAVALTGVQAGAARVSFGSDYIGASVAEWLYENLNEYPVLLPVCYDDPIESLRHLRLHNGTIWRWNRLLIGFDANGQPHLRIENRVLPAGPTFLDMLANAAFYLGMTQYLATTAAPDVDLDFSRAKANFYAAARYGLEAELHWGTAAAPRSAAELLLTELLPMARCGLESLHIAEADIARYLEVIKARVESGQTGAVWQRRCLQACGGDWFKLLAIYAERQRSMAPVHEWDLA